MIIGITILLAFQLLGEVLAYWCGGLIPGPVIGMALIFCAATYAPAGIKPPQLMEPVTHSANTLIANLGVLFVPAGVGIMQNFELLGQRGIALLLTVIVSTMITLSVTVLTFLAVKRIQGRVNHE